MEELTLFLLRMYYQSQIYGWLFVIIKITVIVGRLWFEPKFNEESSLQLVSVLAARLCYLQFADIVIALTDNGGIVFDNCVKYIGRFWALTFIIIPQNGVFVLAIPLLAYAWLEFFRFVDKEFKFDVISFLHQNCWIVLIPLAVIGEIVNSWVALKVTHYSLVLLFLPYVMTFPFFMKQLWKDRKSYYAVKTD